MLLSCSTENPTTYNDQSEAIVTYQAPEKSGTKSSHLPSVEQVESIDENSNIAKQLREDIEKVEFYDVNYAAIRRVKLSDVNAEMFAIPFNNTQGKELKELIVSKWKDAITLTIVTKEILINKNTRFNISNYKEELIYSVDQNSQDLLGNLTLTNNNNGYFLTNNNNYSSSGITSSASSQNCLHKVDFGACMQCAWEECSASWVCGAALILEGPIILAAATTMCAANYALSIH